MGDNFAEFVSAMILLNFPDPLCKNMLRKDNSKWAKLHKFEMDLQSVNLFNLRQPQARGVAHKATNQHPFNPRKPAENLCYS